MMLFLLVSWPLQMFCFNLLKAYLVKKQLSKDYVVTHDNPGYFVKVCGYDFLLQL